MTIRSRSAVWSVLLLAGMVLLQAVSVQCAHAFNAYRLVQFDKGAGAYGSRRTSVNSVATNVDYPDAGDQDDGEVDDASKLGTFGDLSRNIAVLSLRQSTPARLADLIDRRKAAGVLIILPRDLTSVSDAGKARWAKFEEFMLQREFPTPVYFAFEDGDLSEIVGSLQNGVGASDRSHERYQLVVSAAEATPIPNALLYNFQGWQHSAPNANSDRDSQPSIAIVAHYDSFSALPELAFGVDQNGSGTVALLELARIFSRLYGEFRTHGSSNLVFVLTGGGRLNYAGAKQWLKKADPRILEHLDFALCLESLVASDKLYLHVSKPEKSAAIKALYNTFRETAGNLNIPFKVVHKKINISNPLVNWQHEQFSRKRIMAATLSARATPVPMFSGPGAFDVRLPNADKLLQRNIKFIAETICRQVYKSVYQRQGSHVDIISNTHDTNLNFISSWFSYLSTQARVSPFLTKESSVLVELEQALGRYTTEVQRSSFQLEKEFQFYQSPATEMSAYKVKPFFFDLVLALCIAGYLGALHLFLKHVTAE